MLLPVSIELSPLLLLSRRSLALGRFTYILKREQAGQSVTVPFRGAVSAGAPGARLSSSLTSSFPGCHQACGEQRAAGQGWARAQAPHTHTEEPPLSRRRCPDHGTAWAQLPAQPPGTAWAQPSGVPHPAPAAGLCQAEPPPSEGSAPPAPRPGTNTEGMGRKALKRCLHCTARRPTVPGYQNKTQQKFR